MFLRLTWIVNYWEDFMKDHERRTNVMQKNYSNFNPLMHNVPKWPDTL